jgi:hypothetical protein
MAKFNVYHRPEDGSTELVKHGFSFSIVLMNVALLGWVWAFNNRAPRLAWRLLALTVICYIAFALIRSGTILICWIMFSLALGGFANKQIEQSLKRRGYAPLEREVDATIIDRPATKTLALS